MCIYRHFAYFKIWQQTQRRLPGLANATTHCKYLVGAINWVLRWLPGWMHIGCKAIHELGFEPQYTKLYIRGKIFILFWGGMKSWFMPIKPSFSLKLEVISFPKLQPDQKILKIQKLDLSQSFFDALKSGPGIYLWENPYWSFVIRPRLYQFYKGPERILQRKFSGTTFLGDQKTLR